MPPPPPGYETLLGAYTLGRTLWRGTNSHVLAALRRSDGASVAVKAVAKMCLPPRGRAALTREVLTLKRLTQSGGHVAVRLVEVVEDAERVFLITELLQGGTLLQWVLGGGGAIPQVLEVARQLLRSLTACHAMGVCHSDVKLENVMLAAPLSDAEDAAAGGGWWSRPASPANGPTPANPPVTEVDAPADGEEAPAAVAEAPVAEAATGGAAAEVAEVAAAAGSARRLGVDVRLIDFGLCFWRRRPRSAIRTTAAARRDGRGGSADVAMLAGIEVARSISASPRADGPVAYRGGGADARPRGVPLPLSTMVEEYRLAGGGGRGSPSSTAPPSPAGSVAGMPPASAGVLTASPTLGQSRLSGVRLTIPVGTAAYAAPEMVLRQPYDPRAADVWATGVVVYALVAHRLPFGSPGSPGGMAALGRRITAEEPTFTGRDWADVPGGLVALLRRMLCKDAEQRVSMATALEALEVVAASVPLGGTAPRDGNGLMRALAAAEDFARSACSNTAAMVAAFVAATCRLGPLVVPPAAGRPAGGPCSPQTLSRSSSVPSLRSLSPAGSTGTVPGASRGVRRKRDEGDGRPLPAADGGAGGQRAPLRRRAGSLAEGDSAEGSLEVVPTVPAAA